NTIARLRAQMSRGELVLFTGAGFSSGARDRDSRTLPTTEELKRELWQICFPASPVDSAATLGELYAVALARQQVRLSEFLQKRLTVDPDSLPEFYRLYFTYPWLRFYTLNIDDLAFAASRRFDLQRRLRVLSATDDLLDHSQIGSH